MLNSFFVSNFRLFKKLEIKKLSRVNLVVGKNNSGKSAFLEAVRLYASNAHPDVLFDFLISRHEYWAPEVNEIQYAYNQGHAVRHLFNQYSLPDIDGEGIRVGHLGAEEGEIHITVAAYGLDNTIRGVPATFRRFGASDLREKGFNIELNLIKESNGRTSRLIDFGKQTKSSRPFQYSYNGDPVLFPTQVVSTQVTNINKIASLWDITNLTELEDEVINGLKLLEPAIKSIAFVENKSGNARDKRIPLVKYEGMSEPLPLKSMGDGIFRIFNLILALVNARDGILIIDEFENGIHWSVQADIWDIIFRLSKRLNVQVFASTHSQDCVEGFKKAWANDENAGTFLRMEISEDGAKVTPYNLETLSDSIDVAVEVR